MDHKLELSDSQTITEDLTVYKIIRTADIAFARSDIP